MALGKNDGDSGARDCKNVRLQNQIETKSCWLKGPERRTGNLNSSRKRFFVEKNKTKGK